MRRTISFANGEYYHVYNRGVDKRNIFQDRNDLNRFFQSMKEFNSMEPIGSIYKQSFTQLRGTTPQLGTPKLVYKPLVRFVCYCLNPNHYHFVLIQSVEGGISEFMRRMGGYTSYFNEKYKRSGILFQGRFKSTHIDSNEYLLHVSAYVNLNNKVHSHPLRGTTPQWGVKSSWGEYIDDKSNNPENEKQNEQESFCEKDIVLGQFKNIGEYKAFAESSLKDIRENKEMERLLME